MSSFKKTNMYKNTYWYKVGTHLLHREDGPAITYADGTFCWVRHGLIHREDGPSRVWPNGDRNYDLNGSKVNASTDEEFFRLMKLKAFW